MSYCFSFSSQHTLAPPGFEPKKRSHFHKIQPTMIKAGLSAEEAQGLHKKYPLKNIPRYSELLASKLWLTSQFYFFFKKCTTHLSIGTELV